MNEPVNGPVETSQSQIPPAPSAYAPPPIPYMGGYPVRCPRCGYVGSARICSCCGLDLGPVYAKAAPPSAPYPAPGPGMNYEGYFYPSGSGNGACYPGGMNPAAFPPYPPQLPKRKGRWGFFIGGMCLLFLVLLIAALLLLPSVWKKSKSNPSGDQWLTPPSVSEYSRPEGISEEEYAMLQKGMTYAVVSAIIGSDGTLLEQGETISGETYYVYGWYGENNPNAAVYITFTNDVVSEITNEGLTE